jgi:flavorubredoxin/flavin reductase (DIM6/NTAB) family NADH-FMN oxidoreductase RutF
MVGVIETTRAERKSRLTMQTLEIAPDSTALRSLDWDRDRFDIEFAIDNGTTYNSFIVRGDKVALIDTSHEKFRQLYLETLSGAIDPSTIDYIVISHTEPDHSGLVADVLKLAPHAVVVGAKVAIQFLEELVHQPFERQLVKSGDKLELGKGHTLEFISAPNLHWPDTIFTYDHGTGVLYTCDAFGLHFCDDHSYDEDLELIEADYKLYYDCLMGPNARSVLSALKRMEALPQLKLIATGHGPLLQYNVPDLVGRYRDWSTTQASQQKTVALFYVSDYGDSDRLVHALTQGLNKTGVAVEPVDLRNADIQEVRFLAELAAGFVIGMPPQSGEFSSATRTLLNTIMASANSKQGFGLFETGGGDDESVYPLRNRLQELGLHEGFAPILIKAASGPATYQLAEEAATDLGQWLTRDRTVKQMKALDNDLDKALGRLSGGLYILTAQKADTTSAMLASWVSQASFEPLGITIAVAKDRAIEALMQVGDRFVLNVLEEGKYQPLMKHFLKRFAPGADRFAGVKTYGASNGAPILGDALAYLECEVVTRMETPDHWIVYSSVDRGRVSNPDGLTAVHHRKVGNHY